MQKSENCQTVKSKSLRTVTGIGKLRELRETMKKCEKCKINNSKGKSCKLSVAKMK